MTPASTTDSGSVGPVARDILSAIIDQHGDLPIVLDGSQTLLSEIVDYASTPDSGKGRLDAEARLHAEAEPGFEPSDADVARMVKRIEGFSHSYHPEGMARSELDGWIERYPHEWQVLVYTVNKVRRAVASLTASQAHVKHKAEGDCEPQPKDTK